MANEIQVSRVLAGAAVNLTPSQEVVPRVVFGAVVNQTPSQQVVPRVIAGFVVDIEPPIVRIRNFMSFVN